jgi:pentatricopeptide repeat protein
MWGTAYIQARRVLADARARGVLPDVFGYSTLLKGFVREGDLPAALALMEEMQLDGVAPNLVGPGSTPSRV